VRKWSVMMMELSSVYARFQDRRRGTLMRVNNRLPPSSPAKDEA